MGFKQTGALTLRDHQMAQKVAELVGLEFQKALAEDRAARTVPTAAFTGFQGEPNLDTPSRTPPTYPYHD